MASANVSLGSNGAEYEADTTERTATMNRFGGFVTNAGSGLIGVNFEGAAVGTVSHAGAIAGLVGTQILDPGATLTIPVTCRSFKFKADGAGCVLSYSPRF